VGETAPVMVQSVGVLLRKSASTGSQHYYSVNIPEHVYLGGSDL
jgi:hypothetical protein